MAMQAESINDLLAREPFQPFTILAADGREYPVTQSAFVHVFKAEAFYAYPGNDRWTRVALSQVTAIEANAAA